MPDLERYDDWLAWLRERAVADPAVRVAWVGGSAATGGFDDHSDLDVEVLCEPGTAVEVHDRLVTAARDRFEVDHVWALPTATWPDGRQSFLHLQPDAGALTGPTRIVDLHVSDLAEHHRIVDTRRHGEPIVLHDPDGLVELRHDDDVAMVCAITAAVDQVRQRHGTARWLVARAVARGDEAEAAEFHLRFGVVPLVRLLRTEHCPWRHDFGLRYLERDLPAGTAARIARLLPGPDLEARAADTFAWQDELLAMPPLRGLASPGRVVLAAVLQEVLPAGADPGRVRDRLPRPDRGTVTTHVRDDLLVVEHDGLDDADPTAYAAEWELALDGLSGAGPRDPDLLRRRYLGRASSTHDSP